MRRAGGESLQPWQVGRQWRVGQGQAQADTDQHQDQQRQAGGLVQAKEQGMAR
ncbi:hypothetical protein D3C75_1278330 [compost metagenome]